MKVTLALVLALGARSILVAQRSAVPRLEQRGENMQLIVEGKPFFILAGEIRNSSSSSPFSSNTSVQVPAYRARCRLSEERD